MQPYDDALQFILDNGVRKENRTGVDTIGVFGYQARYRIDSHFPILTKRKMFPKSIFKELLWMLSGSTDVNDLEGMGSKIWSAWRDKSFEDKNKFQDGELGPIYGWQLRHFGGDYDNRFLAKGGLVPTCGFDQIQYVLDQLKNNPNSRRILFSYWNPPDVTSGKAKLPPCHLLFQLYVDTKNRLSGMMYQRSCDFPIGVPANVQFYSALIYMLAQQCGFEPYEFIHSTADSHIYVNQIDQVKEYLSREPTESPRLELEKADDMFSYTPDDFKIINYKPQGKIKIPVAV